MNIFITIRGSEAFSTKDPDEYVIRNGDKLNWAAFRDRVALYKRDWDRQYGIKLESALKYYHERLAATDDQDIARLDTTERFDIDAKLVADAVDTFISKVLVAAARDEFGVRKKSCMSWPWITKTVQREIDKKHATGIYTVPGRVLSAGIAKLNGKQSVHIQVKCVPVATSSTLKRSCGHSAMVSSVRIRRSLT